MPHKKAEFNGKKILMCSDQILEMGANVGFAESFAKGFKTAQDKELLDSIFDDPVISKLADESGLDDNPAMDEDPGPDGELENPGQMLPPPPNSKAVGKPPIPQIGDIKQSVEGRTMVYTPSGWKKVKLGDGILASEAAKEFKQSGKISQQPMKASSFSVTNSTAYYVGTSKSYPWNAPGPAYPKPMPPPKKPDPEPMDLTGKRRINLNE